MHARAVAVSCVLFALVFAAGCSAPPGTSEPATVTATLVLHSGEVSIETADGESSGVDGDVLVAGDVVTVSGDEALVELRWSDGAITRLGADTTFIVGEPTDRLGARGAQSGGVSWNRIPPTAADRESAGAVPYVLAVDGGSPVSDRGELFVIDCRGESCRIGGTGGGGADGSKTTFRRGEIETEVEAEKPVSWEALMVDAWAEENAALDEASDLVPVVELFADGEPARGVLEGTFDVLRTSRGATCTGVPCAELKLGAAGDVLSLVYTFHRDCPPTGACSTSVDTQFTDTRTGEVKDDTVPLVTGAETFTWGRDVEGTICMYTYDDGFSAETGHQANSIRWSVTPTKAEVRNGAFVVTELRGTAEGSLEVTERVDSASYPGCETLEVEWASESDLLLTRRDG